MSTKEKARPDVGASERASGAGAACRRATTSRDNHTLSGPNSQRKIASLLSHGQENAVPLWQLISMTDLDGRKVRQMIQAERLAGVPILSDNSTGYYLPANDGDRFRFVYSMRHRAGEITRVARAIEGAVMSG